MDTIFYTYQKKTNLHTGRSTSHIHNTQIQTQTQTHTQTQTQTKTHTHTPPHARTNTGTPTADHYNCHHYNCHHPFLTIHLFLQVTSVGDLKTRGCMDEDACKNLPLTWCCDFNNCNSGATLRISALLLSLAVCVCYYMY